MVRHRYQAIVRQLARVPPEIVHEILNDLPIVKILELVSISETSYLEQCVCSHIELGKVFSLSHLAEVKAYMDLYLRIRQRLYDNPQSRLPELNVDVVTFLHKRNTVNIPTLLKATVILDLRKYEHLFPLLTSYTPLPIPPRVFWADSPSNLNQIFENIDAGMKRVGSLKAEQLKRMAGIIKEYPGMTRVRQDTSQAPRKNEEHRVRYLLGCADRMKTGQSIKEQRVALCVFARRRPFLVPYDRLLRLFLKTMNKFPPDDEPGTLKSTRERRTPHRDTCGDLSKPLPRTKNTKYAAHKGKGAQGLDQPSFDVYEDYPRLRDVPVFEAISPASDKELDWLEAFLYVCKYMSEMEEEWKRGQTVAGHWSAH